jgi:hypothetical protein
MPSFKQVAIGALGVLVVPLVAAQRPSNESICDYYTTALLKNNTAENQMTILTLVVNTAVIGNYTQPNVGIMVPGILASGQMQDGVEVDLLKYFNGSIMSTNRNGVASSVNFLGDGGATPLMKNMPANTNSSAQYFLLTHLYQYFGTLLGCSMQGMGSTFGAYAGDASMYQVHKFMNLSKPEMDYFITQVGLSAASFGVATADVMTVGMALNDTFNQRCSAPAAVIPAQGAQLQAICINPSCPIASNAVCAQYEMAATNTAESSMSMASATGSMMSGASGMTGSATGSAAGGGSTGSAAGGGSSSTAPAGSSSSGNGLFVSTAVWGMLAAGIATVFGFALVM